MLTWQKLLQVPRVCTTCNQTRNCYWKKGFWNKRAYRGSKLATDFGLKNPQISVVEIDKPELSPSVMCNRIATHISRERYCL